MADKPSKPWKFFNGRTVHVSHVNAVEIRLTVSFGISVNKIILLDGIDSKEINETGQRVNALRCLVTLLGGRNVYVHCEDRIDGMIPGVVYIDDFVARGQVGVTTIEAAFRPVLNVNAFYGSLEAFDYDTEKVREIFRA